MRPSRTLARTAAAAVLAGTLAAGCTSIPVSGPVETGQPVISEPGPAVQLPADPVPDAGPVGIVTGFLSAGGAGVFDDFGVARKFLTPTAANSWDPYERVVVYGNRDAVVEQREDGTVLVTVPVEATVDASGRYAEAPPGSSTQVLFRLTQDSAGQYRIAELDNGFLVSSPTFRSAYRPARVYFASPDQRHLVPDLRWCPEARAATCAVSALLEGPSPWLRDAVVTGAPEGARLSTTAAVTVSDDRVALVDLAPDLNRGSRSDRNLLQAQLEATLSRLPGVVVADVAVTVGGLGWEAQPGGVPELERDVAADAGPFVLADGVLAEVTGRRELTPVPGVADLEGIDARSPALSPDLRTRVVLDGPTRLLALPEDAAPPELLLSGTSLVAPSVDRHGWVWSGEARSEGLLVVVRPGGEAVTVTADWLQGREVRSLRVSRDGSRIAVVSVGADDGAAVDVAAVVRDAEGVPQRLSEEPWTVGADLTDAFEVAWVDEVTLAVLGTSGAVSLPAMHLVPVGGPTEAQPIHDGAVGLAAGRRDRALYLLDDDGRLLLKQGAAWTEVVEGVRDPVFPG